MLRFAFFKLGIPTKESSQQKFLNDIKFNVGGTIYNFGEWLRFVSGGRIHTSAPSPTKVSVSNSPVKRNPKLRASTASISSDRRKPPKRMNSKAKSTTILSSGMSELSFDSCADYRLHFATHFFRSKGTAISRFTADNLNEQLRVMAMAFVADDSNVLVDTKTNELQLSNVFSWHKSDMTSCEEDSSGGDSDLASVIFQFVESPKKLQLQQYVYGSKKLKIVFHEDDWTVNAKKSVPFSSSSIEANCARTLKHTLTR